jgi:hypothetical protein
MTGGTVVVLGKTEKFCSWNERNCLCFDVKNNLKMVYATWKWWL